MYKIKPTLITFRGHLAVIRPHRHLTLGEMASLRNAVNAVIGSDYRRIVIDLAEVDVDSSGIGELITYYIEARRAGAFMGLMNLTQTVRNLMVITKLATVFPLIHGGPFSKAGKQPTGPTMPPPAVAKATANLKRAA